MFTQTISFLLGRSAERVRKCSASFMSILMFSSSHLLLHLPVKYVLELHSVSCSWFYMTVWLFFLLFSFFYTHIYRQTSSSYHFSFWRRWWWWRKREKNCAPCWKYLAGTPRRFCFISFKFSFLFFYFLRIFIRLQIRQFPPRLKAIAMLGYMFMGRLMITSAARAAKKKNQPVSQFQQPKRRRTFFFFF